MNLTNPSARYLFAILDVHKALCRLEKALVRVNESPKEYKRIRGLIEEAIDSNSKELLFTTTSILEQEASSWHEVSDTDRAFLKLVESLKKIAPFW